MGVASRETHVAPRQLRRRSKTPPSTPDESGSTSPSEEGEGLLFWREAVSQRNRRGEKISAVRFRKGCAMPIAMAGPPDAAGGHARPSGRFFLLVVVDFLEVGIDDAVAVPGRRVGGLRTLRAAPAASASACWAAYMASPSFIDACINAWVFSWIAPRSSSSLTAFRSSIAFSMASFSAASILSPCSESDLPVWWIIASAALRRRPPRGASCLPRRWPRPPRPCARSRRRSGRRRPGCGSAAPCRSPCRSP